MYNQGARQYQAVNKETSVVDADPHKLIQLLLDGAMAKMAQARGAIERNDIERRNHFINGTVAIIDGLRSSLNMDAGDVAHNLERLYEYMERRLFEANLHNDASALDEVARLLGEIKSAWDGIRDEALSIMENGGHK